LTAKPRKTLERVLAGSKNIIPDLEACSAFGATPAEALAQVELAKAAWLEAARAESKPIDKTEYVCYSQNITFRTGAASGTRCLTCAGTLTSA